MDVKHCRFGSQGSLKPLDIKIGICFPFSLELGNQEGAGVQVALWDSLYCSSTSELSPKPDLCLQNQTFVAAAAAAFNVDSAILKYRFQKCRTGY